MQLHDQHNTMQTADLDDWKTRFLYKRDQRLLVYWIARASNRISQNLKISSSGRSTENCQPIMCGLQFSEMPGRSSESRSTTSIEGGIDGRVLECQTTRMSEDLPRAKVPRFCKHICACYLVKHVKSKQPGGNIRLANETKNI